MERFEKILRTLITEEDIDYIVENTKEVVAYLRSISPVWSKMVAEGIAE